MITGVEAFYIEIPIPEPGFRAAWYPGIVEKTFPATLVKIQTDEEITGIGLSACVGTETRDFIELEVKPLLTDFKDPFDLEKFSELLKSKMVGRESLIGPRPWCTEIALWDVIGKSVKKPIYKLLGGYRDKIKAYLSTGELKSPEERAKEAVRYLEDGFKGIKLRAHNPDPEKDVEVVRNVRDSVGGDMDIMVDANQAWTPIPPFWSESDAFKFAKQMEKYNVLWLEEPLPSHELDAWRRLAKEVEIPIAGGELEFGLHTYKNFLEKEVYDIIQADATMSGGLLETKKIAAMTEAYGKWFIPHCWSAGPGFVANLHLSCSVPNCPWLEYPCEPPAWSVEIRDSLLKEPIRAKNGWVEAPKDPGLGIEIDEEALNSMIRERVTSHFL